MPIYVTFDAENLFFRPGLSVDSIDEAKAFADANNWKIYSISSRPKRWVVDGTGFKPHYNIGLGKYVETKGEFNQELKKRKLVEVGNEKVGKQTEGKRNNYFDYDTIKAMNEMGAGLSDGEAGELIDNG